MEEAAFLEDQAAIGDHKVVFSMGVATVNILIIKKTTSILL
jgi:hypothetical protein